MKQPLPLTGTRQPWKALSDPAMADSFPRVKQVCRKPWKSWCNNTAVFSHWHTQNVRNKRSVPHIYFTCASCIWLCHIQHNCDRGEIAPAIPIAKRKYLDKFAFFEMMILIIYWYINKFLFRVCSYRELSGRKTKLFCSRKTRQQGTIWETTEPNRKSTLAKQSLRQQITPHIPSHLPIR